MAPAMFVLMVSVAIAADQTNGSGLTHEGASLGFNAKANLHGNITYTSHDGTMFQVFCHDGLTSYRNLAPTFALDANADPDVYLMKCNSGADVTVACNDAGIITTGNVQIHQGSPSQAKQTTRVIGAA